MTYITAFMFSMLLLALVIVWSLIEIYMDLRKDEIGIGILVFINF